MNMIQTGSNFWDSWNDWWWINWFNTPDPNLAWPVLILMIGLVSIFPIYGIYRLVDYLRWRRQYPKKRMQITHDFVHVNSPVPLRYDFIVDDPGELTEEDTDILRAEAPDAPFIKEVFELLRSSQNMDLIHEAIYELIEKFSDDILSIDWQWANDKLDSIHAQWVEEARGGNPLSFKKLHDLQSEGLWPDEEREVLPSDWDELVERFTRTSVFS